MNINTIKKTGITTYKAAKKTGKVAYNTVKGAFKNPSARKNAKASLPAALVCTGGFSLFAFLKNRKKDGKQTALEKSSGTLAQIAFAVASFKHFFKNTDGKQLKNAFEKMTKLNFSEALDIIKTNKSNAILYAASVIGVKIATDVVTKVLDAGINKANGNPKLGNQNIANS